MEYYIEPTATMVMQFITQRDGGSICQHPSHHLPEEILTDSGCISEAVAMKTKSLLSCRWVNIHKDISHNVGHC